MERNYASRVVTGWARGGHRCGVRKGALRTEKLVPALHRLPDRLAVIRWIGVEFHPHGIEIHVIQIDLDLENMLTAACFDMQLSESNLRPILA